MGQTTSQPERPAPERPTRRATTSLRRALQQRLPGRSHDGLQEGLLNQPRTRPPPRRPRSRRSSINRLSQLIRAAESDDVAESVISDTHMTPSDLDSNTTLSSASRSRFHEMFRRGEASQSSRARFLRHRHSYVRAGPSDVHGDGSYSPPRLPSIDLSSTFENDTLRPPSEPELLMPRGDPSHRRANLPRLTALRPDRSLRHLTHSLRRRNRSPPSSISSIRSRGIDDQAAMLSRLLSYAAAATAATLMGDDHNALGEARSLSNSTAFGDLGGSGEDGSFDGFLRALQNGRIASALRQSGSESDTDSQGSQTGTLNFFRMFRFGASTGVDQTNGGNASPNHASTDSEGRMVPIIIVGIRSISPNSNSSSGSAAEDLPPFIDALGNFPSPLPAHTLGHHAESIDSILRPPHNSTSFRHRRRASTSAFPVNRSRLSDRMDDQRDHRSPDRRRERPWSMASTGSSLDPRPPPVTPASPSPELSRISSRSSTPNQSRPASMIASGLRDFSGESRRNSTLPRGSAASPLSSHREETASIHSTHSATNLLNDPELFRTHRRSDTAPNIHYPRFASGHPRRNGVVEPDNLPPLSRASTGNGTDASGGEGRNSSGDSRSWIIYVLGGSYPENHPILTTPSLFTENPTYEDMMLLSALLGPAKAPVATEDDVQSAGGVYNITATATPGLTEDAIKTAALVATAHDGSDHVMLEIDQRCLVCLCEFEESDVARKLVKCNHLFHKECIDQWLTTGRNSCPLCREQGVNEKEKEAAAAAAVSSENDSVLTGAERGASTAAATP